jgi:hypothetical protein
MTKQTGAKRQTKKTEAERLLDRLAAEQTIGGVTDEELAEHARLGGQEHTPRGFYRDKEGNLKRLW